MNYFLLMTPMMYNVIMIQMTVPAHFNQRVVNQSVVAGDATVLVCPAQGDAPLRVTWVSGPRSLSMGQMREMSASGGGVSAELQLTMLSRRDTGAYRCVASNEFGQDELTLYLNVKGRKLHVSLARAKEEIKVPRSDMRLLL